MGGSSEILMFYGLRIIPYIYGRPLRQKTDQKIQKLEKAWDTYLEQLCKRSRASTQTCKPSRLTIKQLEMHFSLNPSVIIRNTWHKKCRNGSAVS